ncbi:hypothetical protein [Roseobacter litoralis]|nr:hypothetical protein [Roseobacter litoralis]
MGDDVPKPSLRATGKAILTMDWSRIGALLQGNDVTASRSWGAFACH